MATAIRGAIIQAKMSMVPVRRGYWGNKIGKVHTVPTKITGKCGSVSIRLVPAPRGAGVVAARVPKKVGGMGCGRAGRGAAGGLGQAGHVAWQGDNRAEQGRAGQGGRRAEQGRRRR